MGKIGIRYTPNVMFRSIHFQVAKNFYSSNENHRPIYHSSELSLSKNPINWQANEPDCLIAFETSGLSLLTVDVQEKSNQALILHKLES